jgi:hypothetical protein
MSQVSAARETAATPMEVDLVGSGSDSESSYGMAAIAVAAIAVAAMALAPMAVAQVFIPIQY